MRRIGLLGLAMTVVLTGCSQSHHKDVAPAMAGYLAAMPPQLAAVPRQGPGSSNMRSDAPADPPTWFAIGESLAQNPSANLEPADEQGLHHVQAQSRPQGQPQTQPANWRNRRGPVYQNDFWHNVGRDAKELPLTLWADTKESFTNPFSLMGLAAAGAAGIVLSGSETDSRIERYYTRHGSQLSSFWDEVGDVGGNPGAHFAVAGVMYAVTMATNDVKDYEVSRALVNALAINGVTTVVLKLAVDNHSPNGDPLAWPSGHTSSSFAFATVITEAYGPLVGAPLLGFAGFVGYERIDARNHNFSDVISGALIGIAIGHAVTQNHLPRIMGMEVAPYADPSRGAIGVAMTKQW